MKFIRILIWISDLFDAEQNGRVIILIPDPGLDLKHL